MADLDYFITRDEFATLLEASFDNGFRLCINKNVPWPKHECIEMKESIRPVLESKQHAFMLERADFSRYPVRLRSIEREGVTLWYPRTKEGGPVIEIYFFAPFAKDDARFIPCSLITYHTTIVNPVTGLEEPAGETIKRVYDELVLPIRERFKCVRSAKRTAYVSPGAQAMVEAGWQLAPPFDAKKGSASAVKRAIPHS